MKRQRGCLSKSCDLQYGCWQAARSKNYFHKLIQVELACLDQLLGLLGKNTLFWEHSRPSEYGYLYHVVENPPNDTLRKKNFIEFIHPSMIDSPNV